MNVWILLAVTASAVFAEKDCAFYARVRCHNLPEPGFTPLCNKHGDRYNNKCMYMVTWCNNRKMKFEPCADEAMEGSGDETTVTPQPTRPATTNHYLCEKYKNYNCSGYGDSRPVCDSDGNVYKNYCEIRKIFYCNPTLKMARCPQGPVTTRKPFDHCDYYRQIDCGRFSTMQICDTKGNEYKNGCEYQKAKCDDKTIRRARCNNPIKFSITTPKTTRNPWDFCEYYKSLNCKSYGIMKVCDNKGNVYKNSCEFQRARYCNDSSVVRVRCPVQYVTTRKPWNICDYYLTMDCTSARPAKICDTNGNVYKNSCEYQQAKCNDTSITRTYCRNPVQFSTASPATTKPVHCAYYERTMSCKGIGTGPTRIVCDSKGNEYDNWCVFIKAQCEDPSLVRKRCPEGSGDGKTTPVPKTAYCRYYETLDCSRYGFGKTCDQHGKVYKNRCHFAQASCKTPGLQQSRCPTVIE